MLKLHNRTVIQGCVVIFFATTITCSPKPEIHPRFQASTSEISVVDEDELASEIVDEDKYYQWGQRNTNNEIEEIIEDEPSSYCPQRTGKSSTYYTSRTGNESPDEVENLYRQLMQNTAIDKQTTKIYWSENRKIVERERHCLQTLISIFNNITDEIGCKEYAFFHFTNTTISVMGNEFSRNYYGYLRLQLLRGSVKNPRKFCSSDDESNSCCGDCTLLQKKDDRISLLESIFGKTANGAIERAYYFEVLGKKTDDIRHQYMVHIAKSVELKPDTMNPERYCAKFYGPNNQDPL